MDIPAQSVEIRFRTAIQVFLLSFRCIDQLQAQCCVW